MKICAICDGLIFTELPAREREKVLLQKLAVCERKYDFSNPRAQFAEKELKRRYLVDIVDYVSNTKGVFTEAVYGPFFQMISCNLFRALPIGSGNDEYDDPEDDEPYLEPGWPHMQVVYELLRKFVVSSDTDPRRVRAHIDRRFILSLVELFNSEDPREREYLKTILHRIYGKIMPLRPFVRKAIMNVFYLYVYETQKHNGIAELLEILGSVINGFAVPLKDEHKVLLRRFLVPLHTPRGLPSYHVQLSFCVTQFVEKEPELATDVVRGIVGHWPLTHSRKEVMLLNELEELLELAQPDDYDPVIDILFKRIASCVESPHFQVAERALFFWNNEYVVSLIQYYRAKIIPMVYGALHRNVQYHWNPNVLSLSFNIQKLLSEMDSELYDSSAEAYFQQENLKKQEDKEREERWQHVYKVAEHKTRASRRSVRSDGYEDRAGDVRDISTCTNNTTSCTSYEVRPSSVCETGLGADRLQADSDTRMADGCSTGQDYSASESDMECSAEFLDSHSTLACALQFGRSVSAGSAASEELNSTGEHDGLLTSTVSLTRELSISDGPVSHGGRCSGGGGEGAVGEVAAALGDDGGGSVEVSGESSSGRVDAVASGMSGGGGSVSVSGGLGEAVVTGIGGGVGGGNGMVSNGDEGRSGHVARGEAVVAGGGTGATTVDSGGSGGFEKSGEVGSAACGGGVGAAADDTEDGVAGGDGRMACGAENGESAVVLGSGCADSHDGRRAGPQRGDGLEVGGNGRESEGSATGARPEAAQTGPGAYWRTRPKVGREDGHSVGDGWIASV